VLIKKQVFLTQYLSNNVMLLIVRMTDTVSIRINLLFYVFFTYRKETQMLVGTTVEK